MATVQDFESRIHQGPNEKSPGNPRHAFTRRIVYSLIQ